MSVSDRSPVIGGPVLLLNPYAGDFYSVFWVNRDGPQSDPCAHIAGTDLLADNDITHYGTCFANDNGEYELVEMTTDFIKSYNDSIQDPTFFDKVAINVKNQFLFAYNLSTNGNVTVAAGQTATRTITATLTSGTPNPVYFEFVGLPSGATAVASPDQCTPTCTSTLTIATSASTPAGSYTITVVGDVFGAAIKSTTFTLTVR